MVAARAIGAPRLPCHPATPHPSVTPRFASLCVRRSTRARRATCMHTPPPACGKRRHRLSPPPPVAPPPHVAPRVSRCPHPHACRGALPDSALCVTARLVCFFGAVGGMHGRTARRESACRAPGRCGMPGAAAAPWLRHGACAAQPVVQSDCGHRNFDIVLTHRRPVHGPAISEMDHSAPSNGRPAQTLPYKVGRIAGAGAARAP
jgi:hypothetical protein